MHMMPVPQQFDEHTITEQQFQQPVTMIATADVRVSDVTLWKLNVTAPTITTDWSKSNAKKVQRVSHR